MEERWRIILGKKNKRDFPHAYLGNMYSKAMWRIGERGDDGERIISTYPLARLREICGKFRPRLNVFKKHINTELNELDAYKKYIGTELGDLKKYGIHVHFWPFVTERIITEVDWHGKRKDDNPPKRALATVVPKVRETDLNKLSEEGRRRFAERAVELMHQLFKYGRDRITKGRSFLWDITALEQFVYGTELKETEPAFHLVDVDPHIDNRPQDVGQYCVELQVFVDWVRNHCTLTQEEVKQLDEIDSGLETLLSRILKEFRQSRRVL